MAPVAGAGNGLARRGSHARADVRAVVESALHGAMLGDFQQSRGLRLVEVAFEVDRPLEDVAPRIRIAAMCDRYLDMLQWQGLALRVQAHRHRRARAQRL